MYAKFRTKLLASLAVGAFVGVALGSMPARADDTSAEIASAIQAAPGIRLEGLMSHFASAADFTSQQTTEQIRAFNEMIDPGFKTPYSLQFDFGWQSADVFGFEFS